MSEKAKAPAIRFKCFTDDWEQRKLKEISEKVVEKNANLQYTETFTNSAEFGIISQRDFFDHDISNSDNIGGYYVVRNEDFVYNPRVSTFAPVGPINRNKLGRSGVMSPLYTVFRTHDMDNSFLEQYFKSKHWHYFMRLNGDSGARSDRFSIKDSVLVEMPIPFPSLDEQVKIGEYLTSIDNLITLYQRKLLKLKNVKKAMLEKMFPKNGSNVPEIRFSGFTDAWEQRKLLDNVLKVIDFRGRTPKKLGLDWSKSGYLALSALNVKNGYIDETIDAHYGSQELYDAWMTGNELHQGQVLFTTEAPMGNVAQVPDNKGYILSQRTIAFEVDEKVITEIYLATVLISPNVFNRLTALSSGGTAKGVSQRTLSELSIPIPDSVEEQNKIGEYFRNLYNLITLHEHKLEKLKNIKKACLDKMFV